MLVKKNDQPKHTRRNIVLLVLLALLCVGTAELAACSYFAPDVYQQITAPVRWAAAAAADAFQSGMDAAGRFFSSAASHVADQAVQFWEALTGPKETPPGEDDGELSGQLADDSPLTSTAPIADPAVTTLTETDGRQILTGGSIDITYFYQADETWADQPYGTDTIGPYGCGPTVMAIAVASMTDTDTDPAAMAAWAVKHGYWASKSGSYHSIVPGTARAYGIEVESFSGRTVEELQDVLISGKLLVALMGPGHFTSRGHFILLRGVTLAGEILVADPNSPERSLTAWDPQIILDELAGRASSGGPLWALSLPEP